MTTFVEVLRFSLAGGMFLTVIGTFTGFMPVLYTALTMLIFSVVAMPWYFHDLYYLTMPLMGLGLTIMMILLTKATKS